MERLRALLRETGTALLAGNGCGGSCPRLSTPCLASPSLPCRAAQPHRVAGIAGGDASLVVLFLSVFSHLPPSLGSASRRWVDGRLSGAAASPTASPACLTKPDQGFLPFWAKCFLLRAQVRGKSLVLGIQSILSPQPVESWQDHTERQRSLMPPFESPKQQFILQQPETMRESHCLAAWASMVLAYSGPSPSPGPWWNTTILS